MIVKDKNVLLVDDDPDILEGLQSHFLSLGANVHTSSNGRDAIQEIERHMGVVDLVITDLIMPDSDGIELIIYLRHHFPETKIVAVSGGGMTEAMDYLESAKLLGANRILEKPFRQRELDELVQSI